MQFDHENIFNLLVQVYGEYDETLRKKWKRAINIFDVSSEKWSSSRFDDWIPRVQVSKEYTFHLFNTRFDEFYAEKFRICKYYSYKHWFLDVANIYFLWNIYILLFLDVVYFYEISSIWRIDL